VALEYLGVDIERWRDETSRLGLIHPEDRERLVGEIQARCLKGVPYEFEARMLRHDGQFRYHLLRLNPFKDERGNVTRWYGTATDIEDRKQAEQKLQAQEMKLRRVLDLTPQLVLEFGPNRERLYANRPALDYFGFSLDEWRQRSHGSVVHPDDLERLKASTDRALSIGSPYELELRGRKADGSYRWFLARFNPVRDDKGKVMRWYGAATDIEDRKRAEQNLQAQEIELRQILDHTPQLAGVFGPNLERLYVNRAALDYFGVTLDEWRQRMVGAEVHSDDSERYRAVVDRALLSGSAFELEMRVRKGNGNYRWFLARYNPVRDEKGQVRRWYVACTDIEDRKQEEEKLRRENAALREEVDETSMFEEIVGTSPALKVVLSHISKVAPSDSTVLITGETGTGKELVARAIHRRSARASRAFVSGELCSDTPRADRLGVVRT
jgi:PAS domain S-box-containing protein